MASLASLLLAAPAIPLDEAGKYVAAAYIVFVVLLVIYVAIMAARLGTLSKEIENLAELAERNNQAAAGSPGAEPGEAAARREAVSEETPA